jgi:hypothetical protein
MLRVCQLPLLGTQKTTGPTPRAEVAGWGPSSNGTTGQRSRRSKTSFERPMCSGRRTVLPSLVEPWGIVVVEALRMGLPVIATPAVGAAVSLAGYSGAITLTKVTEPDSIVAAVHRFITRLGRAAHESIPFVRSHFDRIAVARETIRLIYGFSPAADDLPAD